MRLFNRAEQQIVISRSEKQIQAYNQYDFINLTKQLRLIAVSHFAIREEIPDMVMAVTVRMLKNHYSGFNTADIVNAMEACAAGKYKTSDGKIIQPYGSFSVAFVGQVMDEYKKETARIITKLHEENRKQNPEDWKSVTGQKRYRDLLKFVDTYNTIPLYWQYEAVFEWCKSNGWIVIETELTYEEKRLAVIRYLKTIHPGAEVQTKQQYDKVKSGSSRRWADNLKKIVNNQQNNNQKNEL
jgi:hypothetical protein